MGLSVGLGNVTQVPAGIVSAFAGVTAPAGWLMCYGQAVSRTEYSALFTALSTTYGSGDGTTTFNIPDLRGRAIAGVDNMGGSAASRLTSTVLSASNTLGATGGTQTHTLTTAQLASHNHTQDSHNHTQNSHGHDFVGKYGGSTGISSSLSAPGYANDYGVGGGYVAGATATNQATTATNQAAGGGAAHPITQPTIVLNYIIKATQ
jgi:microcystin-dependent protein